MGPTDWLTVSLSLFAVLAGAGISWMFFRTQLVADFRSIKEVLSKIDVPRDLDATLKPRIASIDSEIRMLRQGLDHSVASKVASIYTDLQQLKERIDIQQRMESRDDIASIKATVEQLDGSLGSAVREILSDVKAQQRELAERIQAEFRSQSQSATNTVRDTFATEVEKFVSDSRDREKLLASLVDSFMHGMRVMGDYQRKNIETETTASIDEIEKKISRSIDDVLEEVVELKQQIVALPSS